MNEKEFIKKINGIPIKNSGRGLRKGDGQWHDYILDHKQRKSFALTKEIWNKTRKDAWSHGAIFKPLIVVDFDDGTELAVIDWHEFEHLMECQLELRIQELG